MIIVLVLLLSSASGLTGLNMALPDESSPEVMDVRDRADEAVTFTNVSEQAGLPMIDSGHATFAWGDYNDDDYVDLLIDTVYGPMLFENNGPPTWDFTNVTTAVGLGGPGMANSIWGDYDNDGYLDIYTTWWEESVPSYYDVLWHNSGPAGFTFTNVTLAAGNVTDIYPGKGNIWADVDRDGFLDMYVVNWRTGSQPLYKDYFWHNNGNGTFTDLSTEAGIYDTDPPAYRDPPFAGMGITSGDYNNDGWMDIYVSNYLITPNYLWDNQRNLTFKNVAIEKDAAGHNKSYHYGHSAGSAFGDYNNDGFMDIWVSNLAHKDPGRADICDDAQLLENQGPPWWNFTDVRKQTGIPTIPKGTTQGGYYKDEHYFSANWADMDNDGDIDLFIPQVKSMAWSQTYTWRNNGDGTFTNVTDTTGVKTYDSINGAWADYNNDGFMDIVVDGKAPYTGGTRQVRLFKNNGNSNHWIEFRLEGTENNAPAIGSRVKITVGNNIQIREVEGGSGSHGSQNSLFIHFGLGSTTTVDEVEVRWPNGNTQILTNLAADQIYDIVEDPSGPSITSLSVSKNSVFEDEEITLTATVSGAASTYEWDFEGDGIWDTVQGTSTVKHTYTIAGTYYPGLRVLDVNGELGEFQTVPVKVKNRVPSPNLFVGGIIWEDSILDINALDTTDSESDMPFLEFNFSFGDGQFTGWSKNKTTTHSYPNAGIYDISVSARDDDGDIGTIGTQREVKNRLPEATADTLVTGLEDSPIYFTGEVNDTVSDLPTLEFMWDFGDGDSTTWSNVTSANHTYTENGTFNASFHVRDDDGAEDVQDVIVIVGGVEPIAILGDFLAVVNEDVLVELTGTASDTASDSDFSYMWDFGDGNSTNWSDEPASSHIYTRSGIYTITFSVMDDDGLVGNDTGNLAVLNLLPAATIVEYPAELLEDEPGEFVGAGYDTPSDRPLLSFRWDFGDGNVTEWGDETVSNHSYTMEGDFTIRFEVRDPEGEVHTVEEVVAVINVLPDCNVEVSNDNVVEDEEVSLKASCIDTPSDSDLTHSWTYLGTSSTGPELNFTPTQKGEVAIIFKAVDDEGGEYKEDLTIRVRNKDPEILDISYPSEVDVGDTASFQVNVTDTPSDVPSLTVTWTFELGTKDEGTTVDHIFTQAGTVTVRVVVEDDDGATAMREVKVKVIGETKKPDDKDDDNIGTYLMAAGAGIAVLVVILLLLFVVRPRMGARSREPGPEPEPSPTPRPEETDEAEGPEKDEGGGLSKEEGKIEGNEDGNEDKDKDEAGPEKEKGSEPGDP